MNADAIPSSAWPKAFFTVTAVLVALSVALVVQHFRHALAPLGRFAQVVTARTATKPGQPVPPIASRLRLRDRSTKAGVSEPREHVASRRRAWLLGGRRALR